MTQNHPETVVGFDRKDFGVPESEVSEGYLHNFELVIPENCPCKQIESVDIELTSWSVITNDVGSVLGPGCFCCIFFNVSQCEDFSPVSCPDF